MTEKQFKHVSKTTFTVTYINKFNSIIDLDIKCNIGINAEQTFKNTLNTLPKKVEKTWENISFNQENKNFSIRRDWIHETNFNFEKSCLVTSLIDNCK
jgi:hypothetical protein